jgi:hypothetical protein
MIKKNQKKKHEGICRALRSVLPTKYHSGDEIKMNEKRGMWHIWWTGEVHKGFGGEITWRAWAYMGV